MANSASVGSMACSSDGSDTVANMISAHKHRDKRRRKKRASIVKYTTRHKMKAIYFLVGLLTLASSFASAYDPSPLQDFCVALNDTQNAAIYHYILKYQTPFNIYVFVNGNIFKDLKVVVAEDFFKHVDPGNVVNKLGSNVTPVSVNELPGLNTLGISLARLDFAPKGLIPPHTHPRATEILTVVEGTNRLFTKVLNKGDVFVFPIGLIHFQLNVGYGNAVAISGLNNQNPGVITVANTVFGSTPPISPEVLTKAFQVDKKLINQEHCEAKTQ
ncbi:hypothetical protein HN51_021755 [Arachis hypogaea]